MLEELKEQVCRANLELVRAGLVIATWGNASGADRASGLMVIKPSGVAYMEMNARQMVVVSLASGKVVEGKLKPSSDTATHLELYRAFAEIGGIVHTHSLYATAWAQARQEIPPTGTTHADYFHGPIPCTRGLTSREIKTDYEMNTGKVIVERFQTSNPMTVPAVLVANHAPFTWGRTVENAVENASVLEYIARLGIEALGVNPKLKGMPQALLDRHFFRKHGPDATYGQK
jgi:L-ribulose-5-phosphate 4-epimerase